LADGIMLQQIGLDVTRLDSVSPELELLIHATQEQKLAAVCPSADIAGAEEATSWRMAKRIGEKPLLFLFRSLQVAIGDTFASDVDFS
jgi:hypothetical protein